MLPDLIEIKKLRKSLNFTQAELAKISNVSQSLIAKIESNTAIPSYENAKKIFDSLENVHKGKELKASDLMKPTQYAKKGDKVKKILSKMEDLGISQMPILENDQNIGTISENSALKVYTEHPTRSMQKETVEEILEESLPQVREDTPFSVLSSILNHQSAVLVYKNGKIQGIITKSDLLAAMISGD